MTNRQLALANAALLSSAVGLKRSLHRFAVQAEQETTYECGSGGWPEPHLLFGAKTFRHGFTRIHADKPDFSFERADFLFTDLFSRAFHRISLTFTASAQFILRFALCSLMLGLRMRQSVVRTMATTDYSISTLPANVEAERSILGAILLDNFAYNQAAEHLRIEDFSLDSHRRIYSRMVDLAESSRPIDMITLIEELDRHKDLQPIGDVAYVSSLVEGVPERPSIEHYVKIVRDKFGSVDALLQRGQRITGLATHYTDLDEMTSGLQRSDLVIIAARPSMGKTAFAMNIAENASIEDQ